MIQKHIIQKLFEDYCIVKLLNVSEIISQP